MADAPEPESKGWIIKAWRDLEAMRRVTSVKPPLYDVAVYHCQQAAEKAITAFLVHHGKSYNRTHDVGLLVDLAREIDETFESLSDAADLLTPFATQFRYPNLIVRNRTNTERILKKPLRNAQAIYDFVLDHLPKDSKP